MDSGLEKVEGMLWEDDAIAELSAEQAQELLEQGTRLVGKLQEEYDEAKSLGE